MLTILMDKLLQGRSASGMAAVGRSRVDRIRVWHYGHGTPNWRRLGNCRSTGARASLTDAKCEPLAPRGASPEC